MKHVEKGFELLERDREMLYSGSRIPYFPLATKEVRGSTLYDFDGNETIGFLSSACVVNTVMLIRG